MFLWTGWITGPENSQYEDGIFHLNIEFPMDYPFSPPTIKFTTQIYHLNVSSDGTPDLKILEREQWSPIWTIDMVLLELQTLLSEPDLDRQASGPLV